MEKPMIHIVIMTAALGAHAIFQECLRWHDKRRRDRNYQQYIKNRIKQ